MTHFERPTGMTFASQASTGAFYNKFLSKLEGALTDIQNQVTDLATVLAGVVAAQAAADAAQTAADTADTKARNRMDDLPAVTIRGDYAGTIASGQLPKVVLVKRFDGTTNVSSLSTWTATVESGDASVSIGASTGALTITTVTTTSVILITSTKDGLTLRKRQTVNVELSDPPNVGSTSGAGSSSWTDTTLSSFNSTSMAAVSDELTVTVGASGQVDLSAPLEVSTDAAAPAGSFDVYGIWQWYDSGGAVWTDLGTETQSLLGCSVSQDMDTLNYFVDPGSLSVATSKTGLTPAASEKFRLQARNNFGTRTMYLSGTAAATTS